MSMIQPFGQAFFVDRKAFEYLYYLYYIYIIFTFVSSFQVAEQQSTLEQVGVPGFHVTNSPMDVRVQMYILNFITKLTSDSISGR